MPPSTTVDRSARPGRVSGAVTALALPLALLALAALLLMLWPRVRATLVVDRADVEAMLLATAWLAAVSVVAWQAVLGLLYVGTTLLRLPGAATRLGTLLLPSVRARLDLRLRHATATAVLSTAWLVPAAAPVAAQPAGSEQATEAATDATGGPNDRAVLPPWLRPAPQTSGSSSDDSTAQEPVVLPPWLRPTPADGTQPEPSEDDAQDAASPSGPAPALDDATQAPSPEGGTTERSVTEGQASERVTVEAGDSLWRLACEQLVRHDGTEPDADRLAAHWRRVVDAAVVPSGDPDLLHPGDVLDLPVPAAITTRSP